MAWAISQPMSIEKKENHERQASKSCDLLWCWMKTDLTCLNWSFHLIGPNLPNWSRYASTNILFVFSRRNVAIKCHLKSIWRRMIQFKLKKGKSKGKSWTGDVAVMSFVFRKLIELNDNSFFLELIEDCFSTLSLLWFWENGQIIKLKPYLKIFL